jgi:glycerophosphoryl diester phosphodiesterase
MAKKDLGWLTARPIAHRGFHDLARGVPENSLAAFRAAMEAGYAIECDLHPSSDGVPMVFHDDELGRLTGLSGCVRELTAAELSSLQLTRTRERIPRLADLLDLVQGRVLLVIELKHMVGRDAGFARVVVEALRNYHGPVALMSFDPGLIADIGAAAPKLPRGLTAEGDWRSASQHLNTMLRIKVDFISYAVDDLPTPFPVFARRALRIPLICWTVRTPAQLARARAWADQITFEGFAA